MAKKKNEQTEEQERLTRKEYLQRRKIAEQNRRVYQVVGVIVGLVLIVLIMAVVNETLLRPRQPIATVHGEPITLQEWQERVRYQRAQLILSLEDLRDMFGGDIGTVQQYGFQQINLLMDHETLGQLVLDGMMDELLIRQEAERRGIVVTGADIDEHIGRNFHYFDGESPTPLPTPTQTVQPTPSLTPIPTAVITEALPSPTPFPSPTPGPTATPLPTATPVSLESFQENYQVFMDQLRRLGVDEATFREAVRYQIYRERLMEALAEERGLQTVDTHASFFYIVFEDEVEAFETALVIQGSDYLSVWNNIRSQPPGEEVGTALAREVLRRAQPGIEQSFGPEVAEAAMTLPPNQPSDVLFQPGDPMAELPDRYYVIMISGREELPLTEGALAQQKQQILTDWLEGQRLTGLELTDRWRNQSPRQPALDPLFLQAQPTPTPMLDFDFDDFDFDDFELEDPEEAPVLPVE